jgi:hypothetical protein
MDDFDYYIEKNIDVPIWQYDSSKHEPYQDWLWHQIKDLSGLLLDSALIAAKSLDFPIQPSMSEGEAFLFRVNFGLEIDGWETRLFCKLHSQLEAKEEKRWIRYLLEEKDENQR